MRATVPLPFAGSLLDETRHVCAFFNSDDEEYRVLLPFIKDGFRCGRRANHVVNPDQVTAQVEGSVAYGLSALLYQQCTVKDGRIVEENFDTYPVMLMEDFPVVETVQVPSGDFWGGVGEPTICVAAPAVLNAIYAATGKPIYTHPLKNIKLRA